jgi:hypothetical protein
MKGDVPRALFLSPTMTLTELWHTGFNLSEAWFALAPAEEKDRYQGADDNRHHVDFFRMAMKRGLLDRLAQGEHFCVGVQVLPKPGDGYECLPAPFHSSGRRLGHLESFGFRTSL